MTVEDKPAEGSSADLTSLQCQRERLEIDKLKREKRWTFELVKLLPAGAAFLVAAGTLLSLHNFISDAKDDKKAAERAHAQAEKERRKVVENLQVSVMVQELEEKKSTLETSKAILEAEEKRLEEETAALRAEEKRLGEETATLEEKERQLKADGQTREQLKGEIYALQKRLENAASGASAEIVELRDQAIARAEKAEHELRKKSAALKVATEEMRLARAQSSGDEQAVAELRDRVRVLEAFQGQSQREVLALDRGQEKQALGVTVKLLNVGNRKGNVDFSYSFSGSTKDYSEYNLDVGETVGRIHSGQIYLFRMVSATDVEGERAAIEVFRAPVPPNE